MASRPQPTSPAVGAATSTAPAKTARKSTAREYAEAFAVAILLAVVIRTFVVQAFKIPSGSMLPTLQIGDHILVNKLAYGLWVPLAGTRLFAFAKPSRGDVIVFEYPEDPSKDFIKRVVGVEGDQVEIRNKKVYVNGAHVEDSHAYFVDGEEGRGVVPRDNYGPQAVPPGHVFVMGDNRDRSYDSRYWGFVDFNKVKGKAFMIYFSLADPWWNIRWERLGDMIH